MTRIRTIPAAQANEVEIWSDPQTGISIAYMSNADPVGEGDSWQEAVADLGRQLEQRDRNARVLA